MSKIKMELKRKYLNLGEGYKFDRIKGISRIIEPESWI
jgi:hypothetical protein